MYEYSGMEHMTPGKRVGKGPKYTVTSKHHSIILCTHSMARRGAHNAGGGGALGQEYITA